MLLLATPDLIEFPYREIAMKVALASGIGLLVGLEREWSQKEIGVRTFAITSMLGMLTSIMAPAYVVGALVGVLLLVLLLNVHSLLRDKSLELTTSICFIVVFFLGVLVGQGHNFTAATSAVFVIMLLAWKQELERFAGALRPEEIRSAVLLGMLSVVIYPLLPNHFVDPWELLNPRKAWTIVVVIAGIGFVNYCLLRLYRTRGQYYAAVLGGLVNSTAAVTELSSSFIGRPELAPTAVAVLLITNIAMFLRNVIILQIFAPPAAVTTALIPLAVMSLATLGLVWWRGRQTVPTGQLQLSSPVSMKRVLNFGVLFLVLSATGTVAQKLFQEKGFLVVSLLGGLISSASTTGTAASLAADEKITAHTAGIGVVLTSIASALVNIPLVFHATKQRSLTQQLAIITVIISVAGLLVLAVMLHLGFA